MQKITIDISPEQAAYIQRLGVDVDNQIFILDTLLSNHASDTTDEILHSDTFQHYYDEYEKYKYSLELAKGEFQHNYLDLVLTDMFGHKVRNYKWVIEDFLSLECEVTIL